MVPLSNFIQFGGMNTLFNHAIAVQVGSVQADPENAYNYFVEVKFRLYSAGGAPNFGEKDIAPEKELDGTPSNGCVPRKLVSVLSEEAEPSSTDVTVIDGRLSDDLRAPVSESYSDEVVPERGDARGQLAPGAPQHAVYLPDALWISRTQGLSAILKEREVREKAENEPPTANVVSVRGAVRVVAQRNDSGSRSPSDDSFFDDEFAPGPPSTDGSQDEGITPAGQDEHGDEASHTMHLESLVRAQKLRKILSETGSPSWLSGEVLSKMASGNYGQDVQKTAEATSSDARPNVEQDHTPVQVDKIPKGCGLLRTSSLKSTVKTLRRSLSRNRMSGRPGAEPDRSSPVHSARANKSTSHTVDTAGSMRQEVSGDEIQPNPLPQRVGSSPGDPVTREDERRDDRTGWRSARPGDGLLRKTSNLARAIFRNLSSGDRRDRGSRAADTEGTRQENEDPSGMRKRRSLFRMRSFGDENATAGVSPTSESKGRPGYGQSKFIKRPSLLFGRRYKE